MQPYHSITQPQAQIRKGLAIASLVLGIISIPTLGLLGVGAVTAITLGAIALAKIKKDPATYGGKGMAIAGIITSAASLFFGVIGVAVILPLTLQSAHTSRESAAIQSLRMIHNNQITYYTMKGRFGALKELADEGLLDPTYVGVPKSGYIYTSAAEAAHDEYCVQATRQSASTASKDFNIDQGGSIRYLESKSPSPVPCGKGALISGN